MLTQSPFFQTYQLFLFWSILNIHLQEESWQPVNDQKSANPFDLPYDSEYESNDMVCTALFTLYAMV